MQLKCKVGDQHLTAEGLSSARFSAPADAPAGSQKLIIVSAPVEIIAALGLRPGQTVTLTIEAKPDDTQ